MEGWLKETIGRLPDIFRSDVEGLIRDGDFISFAGSYVGELSSLSGPLARIADELGLSGRRKKDAGREPGTERRQRNGAANDHGAAREGETEEAVKLGSDKTSEVDETIKARTNETDQIDEATKLKAKASERLREWLASAYRQAEGGERAAEAGDRLLLADSAAGALELAIRALLLPGDAVLVESPSSPEALWALRRRGAVLVPVQCDRDGMLPDDLRRQLRAAKPALVYVTPLHSTTPSGAVWSQQRMLALLEQCDRHRVPIVEDGTACGVPGFAHAAGRGGEDGPVTAPEGGQVTGGAGPAPARPQGAGVPGPGTASIRAASDSIFSLWLSQAKWRRTSVVLLDSFERAMFPSLPLAWLRGNTAMLARLAAARTEEAGLAPASNQTCLMLYKLLTDDRFSLSEHTAAVLDELNTRRIYMKELLTGREWRKAEVHDPGSGLFLWVRLPEGIVSEALLKASMLEGVAFTPGIRCYAAASEKLKQSPIMEGDWIRLNSAAYPAMGIAEGIARIEDALAEFTARS
ncbi:PLP-dependent aminotransferase family protein [Paenibacillus motobuensis]|uniref:Aminotransferase class I/classII large domain-containing protein n=1 Tax=Paenibacillus motobuensis TaxID=295324 RepID=A0ABN0Y610_9BACL